VEHIAIDLGGRESQICVRGKNAEILDETRVPTQTLDRYLRTRAPGRVILETSAEAFTIADQALDLGHEVRVVPATLVRALGVGARKLKTDKRDARVLSEVSCRIDLPSVHIPSVQARELKTVCGMRDALIAARTKLANNVTGWLRTHARRTRRGATNTFVRRVRQICEDTFLQLLPCVERQLIVIQTLNEQIAEADKELRSVTARIAICRRLMTVPGVGPVTCARFTAAIDDVRRFGTASAVASYLGLVPGENSSSDKKHRLAITKAGSTRTRWVLVQAAWSIWRTQPLNPMVVWAKQVASRRGKYVAIVALARKLTSVMFAIWRDGTIYHPLHRPVVSAQPEGEPTSNS